MAAHCTVAVVCIDDRQEVTAAIENFSDSDSITKTKDMQRGGTMKTNRWSNHK